MFSGKKAQNAADTVQQTGLICSKNYKAWIWALVGMALLVIVWALYEGSRQYGSVTGFLSTRGAKVGKKSTPVALPAAGGYIVPLAQSGMISSRNRTIQAGDMVYENLIQTDSEGTGSNHNR